MLELELGCIKLSFELGGTFQEVPRGYRCQRLHMVHMCLSLPTTWNWILSIQAQIFHNSTYSTDTVLILHQIGTKFVEH